MSFIVTDVRDNIIQIEPFRQAICANDFLGDKYNMRIVKNTNDSIRQYALNVPICLLVTTYHANQNGSVIIQKNVGAHAHQTLQIVKNEKPASPDSGKKPVMHKHDYVEMVYVSEGEFNHYIEDKCSTYTKGETCLLNKNVYHGEQFFTDCKLVHFCFAQESIAESLQNNLIKKKSDILYKFALNEMDHKADYIMQYIEFISTKNPDNDFSKINLLISMLYDELYTKQHGQSQMVKALLVRLFSNLLDYPERYSCNHVVLDTKSEDYIFNRISRCIEQSARKPTRNDLAQEIGYCGDYINRIVKKHSGMSLNKYIHTISIKKAEQMLRFSDESISKIISTIGFENKTHFYALFEEKYGMTPLKYRSMYR